MKKFENMTPGEKASYCKTRYEQLKYEAELRVAEARKIKASGRVVSSKMRSAEKTVKRTDIQLAEEIGESRTQVQRYLRLAQLIPDLLGMVNDGTISIMTAVEISFLSEDVQMLLLDYIMTHHVVVSYEVRKLRDYMRGRDSITKEGMERLFSGRKQATVTIKSETAVGEITTTEAEEKPKITFTEKKLRKYFPPKYTKTDMENVMTGFLEFWKNEQDKKEE